MFCCAVLCVLSSFAIILMGKRKLVALLCLPVTVPWLFLAVPLVDLQCVVMVFPYHTPFLLFLLMNSNVVYQENSVLASRL